MEKKFDQDGAPRMSSSGRQHSPTRETLLRLIEAESAAVSVPELAERTRWHENTVRGHLQALYEDGYLARERDERSSGQGRPAWLWSATRRRSSDPYAALAGALAAQIVSSSPNPAAEAREAGRSWGRALAADLPPAKSAEDARQLVVRVMREQGFSPEDGDSRVSLRQCPLVESAAHHPQVVCSVHLGMVSGILETIGAEDGGSELTPFAAPGSCELLLRIDER